MSTQRKKMDEVGGEGEGLRRRRWAMSTQAPNGELCKSMEKLTHDRAFLCNHFVALLRVCAKNKDLYRGNIVHNDVLKHGLLEKCLDALVIMYAKCSALAKAQELLDMHQSRDVISWTALIAGYAQRGQGQDALNCFEQMQCKGLSPNSVTFICVLKACGSIGASDKGEEIHDEIVKQGLLGK
eukprot:c22838_g2_i1 orf=111-659(+)